ncbi:MAG: 3-deoxy-8-phosphooctulonate synthase [Acidobacteriota bacterium]
MSAAVSLGRLRLGGGGPLFLVAGPCVIESRDHALMIAGEVDRVTRTRSVPFVFKASCDKANRTSRRSFRGLGVEEGLQVLQAVKDQLKVPILTDVHSVEQVQPAAAVVDVLQIPAFLCRQTDLLAAAARSGRAVNIKKGQFLAPWDMKHVAEKVTGEGNSNVLLTERGASFGYNNLVVDMRSFPILRSLGFPVVFDATHSVQLPGGAGDASSGQAHFIFPLARAAAGAGIDGLFVEVHEQPERALSDGPNALRLDLLGELLDEVLAIDAVVRRRTTVFVP